MSKLKNDRPAIELSLSADGLLAKWGPPQGGPWGNNGVTVSVKEWWLLVGTTVSTQNANPQGGFRWEIFNNSVGVDTQHTIPSNLLPTGQKVFAQVIGFFDSKKIDDTPIVEGIFSDVTHVKIV